MKLIHRDIDGSWSLDEYLEHLQGIAPKLPPNARDYALAPWHYDIEDHRCPHDSWVESLSVNETAEGARRQIRTLEIKVRLLGAFHDGRIELIYSGVQKYDFNLETAQKGSVEIGYAGIGHGDWIVDEILMDDTGLVTHEIVFSNSGHWKIACADLKYLWVAMPS